MMTVVFIFVKLQYRTEVMALIYIYFELSFIQPYLAYIV